MINTFVDGGVAFVVRDRAGKQAKETKRVLGPLPLTLALVRDDFRVDAYVIDGTDRWVKVGTTNVTERDGQIGLAVCSHRDRGLTMAEFSGVSLRETENPAGKVVDYARMTLVEPSVNRLASPTLQAPGDSTHAAAGWNQWGSGFRREETTKALVWSGEAGGESGLWQDVNVFAGETNAFAVQLSRENSDGKALKISISLEGTVDGKQVTFAERTIESDQLESVGGWNVVRVEAPAVGQKMRAIIRMSSEQKSESSIAIEGASFYTVPVE
jgi:hypothetical protein